MTTADCTLIDRIIARGGPVPPDYAALDAWAANLHEQITAGLVSRDELASVRSHFDGAFSPETLQGFALAKPHGYAGDFEIIDRIYQQFITPVSHLRAWDVFWQAHAAPTAVRNRKSYFHDLLTRHASRRQPLRVLKVATGPGRSMFEWLTTHPAAQVMLDCVEIDAAAIQYATNLNRSFLDRITFIHKNALRYRPARQYDLIWSAGLYDYFDDRMFRVALRRLLPVIAPGGELVIGNFSHYNPSRCWMELSEWFLHHRSADQLFALARQCGVSPDRLSLGRETQGVNLFLHITSEFNQVP